MILLDPPLLSERDCSLPPHVHTYFTTISSGFGIVLDRNRLGSIVIDIQIAQPRHVDHHRNDRKCIHVFNCWKDVTPGRKSNPRTKHAREQSPIQVTIQPSPNSPGGSCSNEKEN